MSLDSRFWPVFTEKAELCASGDTSLRADVAAELMASMEYVLSRAAGALAAGGPREVFYAAENALRADVERTLKMFERMQDTMVPLHSRIYRAVPSAIAPFFRQYRYHLFAHQIPCMLDYQPALPVENRQGVDYIADYIARIMLENALLSRFAVAEIEGLLQHALPDWRDSIENIYTPVLINAAALTLMCRDARSLHVPADDRPAALAALRGENASARAAAMLFTPGAARDYAEATLRSIEPRFAACTQPEGLFGSR